MGLKKIINDIKSDERIGEFLDNSKEMFQQIGRGLNIKNLFSKKKTSKTDPDHDVDDDVPDTAKAASIKESGPVSYMLEDERHLHNAFVFFGDMAKNAKAHQENANEVHRDHVGKRKVLALLTTVGSVATFTGISSGTVMTASVLFPPVGLAIATAMVLGYSAYRSRKHKQEQQYSKFVETQMEQKEAEIKEAYKTGQPYELNWRAAGGELEEFMDHAKMRADRPFSGVRAIEEKRMQLFENKLMFQKDHIAKEAGFTHTYQVPKPANK